MHSINREAGSERMFDYYLNKRHEYLQATGKTLLDFGVVGNDVAKLRRAFYVRIAKHTSQRALDALKGVEKELSSLKTERFLLPKDEDDFGLTEVKRRIALLSYATEEDESPSI
jgi:hypothetical protein